MCDSSLYSVHVVHRHDHQVTTSVFMSSSLFSPSLPRLFPSSPSLFPTLSRLQMWFSAYGGAVRCGGSFNRYYLVSLAREHDWIFVEMVLACGRMHSCDGALPSSHWMKNPA